MTLPELLSREPRTSVQKLEEALEQLAGAQAGDTHGRMLLTAFRSLLPTLRRGGYIPSDPAELDALLLVAARWTLGMRSDAAWQPETINDLFLGPDAQDALQEASHDAHD